MSTSFLWNTTSCRSARLSPDEGDAAVEDRQDRVPGFSTDALATAHVLVVGAGGLGAHIACGLARKGAGVVSIVDHDTVEASNLNRQPFFAADIGQAKALCLARHVAAGGYLGSRCVGHHVAFRNDTADMLLEHVTVCLCGVDNNVTRRAVSLACRGRGIPCIHLAVSETADFGWLFVEETGDEKACVGCVFPRIAMAAGDRQPCRAVPATLDILLVLGGLALRAVDSLLMPQPRYWNFRDIHLAAGGTEQVVTRRPGCHLCGGG